ncbi:MAG: hypothetical protein ACKVSF_15915, partial [Alphaproteobacteria bacterium]
SMMLVGLMLARFNPKVLAAFGFVMIAFSSWIMQGWAMHANLREVAVAGFFMGTGVAMAYVSLTVMAMATLPAAIRVEGVSLYSLMLNMGSGMGIAIAVIVLSQNIQMNHEILAANVSKFSQMFRDHLLPHAWDFGSKSGLTTVDKEVMVQASALAFNQTFRLMAFNAAAIIPFLYLLSRPPRAGRKV